MGGKQQAIRVEGPAEGVAPIDLKNIQGDIVLGMAKMFENFIFFSITKQGQKDQAKSFREQLKDFVKNSITSAEDSKAFRELIDKNEEKKRLPNKALNIAFSSKGLNILGLNLPGDTKERIDDQINDVPFTQGQLARAEALGDDITNWDPLFTGKSDPSGKGIELKDGIHGVIMAVASDEDKLKEAMNDVSTRFQIGKENGSIQIATIKGHVRAPEPGHEHFGFKDGITQPFIDGLGLDEKIFEKRDSAPSIDPGIILLSRRGDTAEKDNPKSPRGPGDKEKVIEKRQRPTWAMDGSFLVFRKLEQRVPEFRQNIEALAKKMEITPERLGARLVGRWKNGGSVQKFPDAAPSQQKADDRLISQDFTYNIGNQDHCPFVAHVRKTNPRQDLDPLKKSFEARGKKDPVIPHRILRRGIQYGPEVGPNETQTDPNPNSDTQRGLLFACYQSSIEDGFEFIQNRWVSDPTFPPNAKVGEGRILPNRRECPGIDPLIGTPTVKSLRAALDLKPNDPDPKQSTIDMMQSIIGANPDLKTSTDLRTIRKRDWVVSRGGEYFFSPSIANMKEKPFAP